MPEASNSLLIIILDVSPLAWGSRDFHRKAQDKARFAKNRTSLGPATLEEVLDAVQAFGGAVCSIERDAGLIIIGVADNEVAVVYPRKDVLAEWLEHPDSYQPNRQVLERQLTQGVADLVARAAARAEKIIPGGGTHVRQAAIAAAFSRALCMINRFLVAAKSNIGVSALSEDRFMHSDGEGIVALMGSSGGKKKKNSSAQSAWSPRIMIIQASDDRGPDYNAVMNCAFAAVKHQITVDGCFLTAGKPASSAFLEQVCDLTGGVFLAPSGPAQVGGALTEVFLSVFLSPLHARNHLNLPALNKVDFRARCFETGNMIDLAFTCNQCLSVFSNKPKGRCPTCQANIADTKRRRTIDGVGSPK